MIVVLDNFTLDAFLNMTIFSLIFFIEHSQFGDSFLKIDKFSLGLFDSKFNVRKMITIFVDSSIKFVIFIFVALNFFPEDFFLKEELFVVSG